MNKDKESLRIRFYGGEMMAFIPTLIYIVFAGIMVIKYEYYSMKSVTVGAIIGMLIGFFLCKDKNEYWDVILESFTKKNNMNLILVFMVIGIFTNTLSKCDIGHGFIWLSQKIGLSGSSFVVFAFWASAIIGMGSGAPVTGLYAVVPIMYPPGLLLGARPEILLGALIGGVFLGDNLSPSSQVTLVTASGQKSSETGKSADPIEVIRTRLPYILVVAIISSIMFYIFNGSQSVVTNDPNLIMEFSNPKGLIMLIPLIILLVISFKTNNLFLALTYAIISSLILGVGFGLMEFKDIVSLNNGALTGVLFDGIYGMVDVIISTMLLFGLIALMIESGAIDKVGSLLGSINFVKTKMGTEFIISIGITIVNILLAGAALPAILLFSSLANKLGNNTGIDPVRRTYLLTINAFHVSAIFPLSSSFIMGSITILNQLSNSFDFVTVLSPIEIFKGCFYNILLLGLSLVLVFGRVGSGSKKE